MVSRPLFMALGWIVIAPIAQGGKHGFADKPGGGKNDPVIEISASTAPNTGSRFSRTIEEANAGYVYDGTQYSATPPPVIPQAANGANQFIAIKFPFKISSKKVKKTIMKPKPSLGSTSFLTPNVLITDENGLHVKGIPTIKGKDVNGKKLSKNPFFPTWLNAKSKNKLVNSSVLAYIADQGDGDIATPAAFGSTAADPDTSSIGEVRIRINKVDGVIINGFWVLKMGDGTGAPSPGSLMAIESVEPTDPVTPEQEKNGNPVVEVFSRYVLRVSEPVVPWSVGFAAKSVNEFNSDTGLPVPLLYNGNTAVVPNPLDLTHPYFPNYRMSANPTAAASYNAPFDVRPINPNNLSEYVLNPLLDLPSNVPINLTAFAIAINANTTPNGTLVASALTSLYNETFNDASAAASRTFHTGDGRAFVNAPVSPSALYYAPVSGSGVGVVNLDGSGFETNDPATERLMILTSVQVMCNCVSLFIGGQLSIAGSHLNGCNGNTFGDATGAAPIGIAGNPAGSHLGPSTPVPGVNEGSVGSTANGNNPFGVFPPGFETVTKSSSGDPRLTQSPQVGPVLDMAVGGFLDVLFFDTQNVGVVTAAHQTFLAGGIPMNSNSISDPPVPNPPPLRLPVGLQPVDVVFDSQKLLKPAFVLEGDEVYPPAVTCVPPTPALGRVVLKPNPINPTLGDLPLSVPQNGPTWQTFGVGTITPYSARQQIGNFLYLADPDSAAVSILNSNTFTVLDRVSVPDPTGLGMAPDNKRLYVSNFAGNSLSIIDTDPLSANFHTEVTRINVGEGPRAVSVQPDNEDVLIANYLDDSVSFLEVSSFSIRNTVSGPFKRPIDVVAAPRQHIHGWFNQIYIGYIAGEGSDNIVMYESGPDGPTGVGADDVRWALSHLSPLDKITSMVFDSDALSPNGQVFRGGVFVTHTDGDTGLAMCSRVTFVSQLPGAGPFPPVAIPGTILSSPGTVQRIFEVTGFWGGPLLPFSQHLNPGGQDQSPRDVALSDSSMFSYHADSLIPANFYKSNFGAWNGMITGLVIPQPGAPVSGSPTNEAGSSNSKHPMRQNNNIPFATYIPDRMYVSFPGDDRIVVLDPHIGGSVVNVINGVPRPGVLTTYFDQ